MDSDGESMRRLNPFVGEWKMEAFGSGGRSVFEWIQNGRYLVQRTEIDHPEAPDSMSVIAAGPEGGYVVHYFDSRGVVRLYQMTFDESVWTLLREKEDFSPLDFRQRYTGTFSTEGRTIEGTWEIAHGPDWEKDFDLSYTRLD